VTLAEWAYRWHIPPGALEELCRGSIYTPDEPGPAKSEGYVQSEVRLEAPREGVYLFRNNVGAGKLEKGQFVRWGLANDSKKLNEKFKSGDLIGIRKRLITADLVGSYIGQFVSREIKESDWTFRGTLEEYAQMNWATLINAQGGDAKIVTGVGSLKLP
jgi:hypothetical protein